MSSAIALFSTKRVCVADMIILFQLVRVTGSLKPFSRMCIHGVCFALSVLMDRVLHQHQWTRSVMVGDGVTDLETRDVVEAFIGYSGIKDRPNVQEKADWSVQSFFDLVDQLQ